MGLFDLFRRKDSGSGAPAEVDGLVRQLADPDPRVRASACRALGALGNRAEAAVPALLELLNDDDGDVCNAAAAARSAIERVRP